MPETVAETPQQLTLTRRDFLVTKLTTGFALATLPISAEISIAAGDGKIPAYQSIPQDSGEDG